MKKKGLVRFTALFFVLMFGFTILSRAAYQQGTAVVLVSKPENRMITHQVNAAGKVEQNQERAVVTEADQRVTAIHVREGQRVEKGDLLFEIDGKLLDEKILHQQQEMEKFKLQMEDSKSQKEVGELRKANDQSQASENYSLSTGRANAQLARAAQNLQDARTELEQFQKRGNTVPTGTEVEKQLEKDLEEKQEAYILTEQELTTLQWKMEQAVDEALQTVKNDSVQGLEPEAVSAPDEDFSTEDWDYQWPVGEDTEPEPGNESGNDLMPVPANLQEAMNSQIPTPANPSASSPHIEINENKTFTQEERDQIEKEIRGKFQTELDEARKKVETAKAEKDAAESALEEYQQERLAASGTQNAETEKQLLANVRAAQGAYTDASIAANEAAVTGGRAVRTAGLPDASDSSGRINEITYEQMQMDLEKLEKIKEDGGKILAPADGLVIKINIMTGEKTTDMTAILLADLSKGYRFTADITKEQEKYLGTGDFVTITGGNKKKKLENLPVTSVMADETNEELYHVTVQLPDDSLEIGMSANLEMTKKSQSYPVCVPLSALHLDEKNQIYVLVPDEYETIMGTEIRARKVGVSVLEQNESYAALAEGGISNQQVILVHSNKPVDDGSRIRVDK